MQASCAEAPSARAPRRGAALARAISGQRGRQEARPQSNHTTNATSRSAPIGKSSRLSRKSPGG
eukprot:5267101-Pleurochrysis_carterae.AAC.1